jgi:hypothetical protein
MGRPRWHLAGVNFRQPGPQKFRIFGLRRAKPPGHLDVGKKNDKITGLPSE